MKILKRFIVIIVPILIVAGYFIIKSVNSNWPVKFNDEFDTFFGNGNWESISKETKH